MQLINNEINGFNFHLIDYYLDENQNIKIVPDYFECYQIFKKEIIPVLRKLFQKTGNIRQHFPT